MYTRTKGFISSGGYDFAKEILYKSIGQEAAEEVLEKLSRMKLANQTSPDRTSRHHALPHPTKTAKP